MSVRMVNWKVLHPFKSRKLIVLLIFILTLFYARKQHNSKKKKDWHNYEMIRYEEQRIGLGEQGKPAILPAQKQIIHEGYIYPNGINGELSDNIPLNRSLPDVRHPACKKKLYLESLPQVSVIVPIYNEHLSVLLRTIYSVQYRAPEHLIKEIFIVDDGSNREYLKEKLEKYMAKHMPKVKVLRLANHSGIVAARQLGAKAATADVLVFLDAHVEANVNWLPPLLEPLVLEQRTVVCPLVDAIDYQNFMYNGTAEGGRGLFNWDLDYIYVDLPFEDANNIPEPYETPIMLGGLFAINRDFFWELGGYDTGLVNWGFEQFEFSFKNVRRVVEVWLDEYAEYVYERHPDWYLVDPGDLTEQKALRKKCKPFKWFMSRVAYDVLQYYPLKEPAPHAEGRIRPMLNLEMCVDGHEGEIGDHLILTPCRNGSSEQTFQLTWDQHIVMLRYNTFRDRLTSSNICWDVPESEYGPVLMIECHHEGGNQQWKYRQDTKTFVHLSGSCLNHNPNTLEILMTPCDWKENTQKWAIDNVNEKQMQK